MHIVVSWNIKALGARKSALNDEMKSCLKDYSWARPLENNVYVVKIDTAEEREILQDRLLKVAKEAPEKVHFLMSPAMDGGRYNGWLPRPMWAKINKRVD